VTNVDGPGIKIKTVDQRFSRNFSITRTGLRPLDYIDILNNTCIQAASSGLPPTTSNANQSEETVVKIQSGPCSGGKGPEARQCRIWLSETGYDSVDRNLDEVRRPRALPRVVVVMIVLASGHGQGVCLLWESGPTGRATQRRKLCGMAVDQQPVL